MNIFNYNKKLIFVVAIVLICLALSLISADNVFASSEGEVYGTGSDGLNVRSGPGSNYSVIDSLWDGDTVTIVETIDGWYKISYSSKSGYVSSKFIKINEENKNTNISEIIKTNINQ